jgi:DNA/RNA endonuclease G (NUC1)
MGRSSYRGTFLRFCLTLICAGFACLLADPAQSEKFVCAQTKFSPYAPLHLDGFSHLKYAPAISDMIRDFGAYVAQFDSDDDDDRDGIRDYRAVPEWVAYELKGVAPDATGQFREPDISIDRPQKWYEEQSLSFLWQNRPGITRKRIDDSYSGVGEIWNRGHLMMSDHAQRIGAEAACNTHHFWNAVPQAADMNQGPWRHLENYTAAAANKFRSVWIIVGPIVDIAKPVLTIGGPGEVPVVVPHALYKIVIREGGDGRPDVLGFIFEQNPQQVNGQAVPGQSWVNCKNHQQVYNHTPNLRSVREIGARTGLHFFGSSPPAEREMLLNSVPQSLWPIEPNFWDESSTCAGQRVHPAVAAPTH